MSTNVENRPGPLARVMERIGYGAGCAAGAVALLLLWTFEITSCLRDAVRPRSGTGAS